ncbi:unnamed protein product [Hymenolepis diminuta]|uniref:PLAT domain-containing protein n=1 Tax=Hymenolepis diminuta TaxID=6216 RepID=A0A0R3SX84_HYMDI|nr:unnamed protein product [Hymenolepis diminuta]VUZ44284.1 unnamed protein product [Hymenolepis diminuta]
MLGHILGGDGTQACYATDRNFDLVSLYWIDEPNLIQFPDENETRQVLTLKPTNGDNLVRACNLCLHVAEITHPTIPIHLSKQDSLSTQL